MRKTTEENIVVSNSISQTFGITFKNEEFSLGKWGDVDNWCELSYDTIVLLECEKAQKHPTTNVLKLYPFLEENPQVNVILIHYFSPENKVPKNRMKLCHFMGGKLEKEFGERFRYVLLKCSIEEMEETLKTHYSGLSLVLGKYQRRDFGVLEYNNYGWNK